MGLGPPVCGDCRLVMKLMLKPKGQLHLWENNVWWHCPHCGQDANGKNVKHLFDYPEWEKVL